MDVHIYRNRKYLRTIRNVKPGQLIDIEGDPREYKCIRSFHQSDSVPDATGNDHENLPETRWPEGSEL